MSIKIWLDSAVIERRLLNGAALEAIEREIMSQKLSEIQGQFIMDFGIEGVFKIDGKTTNPSRYGTSRTAFKISAADARTAAVLAKNPGWLGKFVS